MSFQPGSMKIRTLIADDEPLARERLRRMLATDEEIAIVKECRNGREVIAAVKETPVDLVLLDIEMPRTNGFRVIERIGVGKMPAVIFVTAHDSYAVKAFEVHAVDYLLKPFDRERFFKALERARRGNLDSRLWGLIEELRGRKEFLDRLVVRSGGRVLFLRVDEVDYIEAAGNYVRLHSGGDEYLYRETMARREGARDPAKDARMSGETFRLGYPRLDEFATFIDPAFRSRFWSRVMG